MRIPAPQAALCALLLSLFAIVAESRAITVSFGSGNYVALQTQVVELTVEIAYSGGDPGTPNLFSYGVRVDAADPLSATGLEVAGITAPAALDFTEFSPGATADLDPEVAAILGNVQNVGTPYAGSLVATFQLIFNMAGQFVLQSANYEPLGPDQDVWLTGDGTIIDDFIDFQDTTVRVIPLPEVRLPGLYQRTANIEVHFDTETGATYTLETSTTGSNWTPLTTVAGDGTPVMYTHVFGGVSRTRFYRVIVSLQ